MLKSNHISIDSITPRSSAARKQLNEEAYFDLRSAAADGRLCECTETGTAPQLAGVLGKLVPVAGILQTSDQPNSWETQAIFWAMYCCLQSTASHRRESAFWVHCRLCSQPPSLSPAASSHRHFRQVMEQGAYLGYFYPSQLSLFGEIDFLHIICSRRGSRDWVERV